MTNEWIVVLEVVVEPGGSVGMADIAGVVHALGDVAVIALSAPNRYAVQLPIIDQTCGDALLRACLRWRDAVRQVGLPASDVVRAEVLAASEFERERQGSV